MIEIAVHVLTGKHEDNDYNDSEDKMEGLQRNLSNGFWL
jgi:hypothetical protein